MFLSVVCSILVKRSHFICRKGSKHFRLRIQSFYTLLIIASMYLYNLWYLYDINTSLYFCVCLIPSSFFSPYIFCVCVKSHLFQHHWFYWLVSFRKINKRDFHLNFLYTVVQQWCLLQNLYQVDIACSEGHSFNTIHLKLSDCNEVNVLVYNSKLFIRGEGLGWCNGFQGGNTDTSSSFSRVCLCSLCTQALEKDMSHSLLWGISKEQSSWCSLAQ